MELDSKFFELRAKKDNLKKELEGLQKEIDRAESELTLWLEGNNLTQIKGDNGTLFLRGECYARIADQDSAFKWLHDNNMSDVIKQTVHAKILSSIVKDHGEIPGIVASYVTKIGVRSNNKGDSNE